MGVLANSVEEISWPSCVGKGVYVKKERTQCRHYKTSIFSLFLLKTPDSDRIVCVARMVRDGSGKTGRSRYFHSWVSLRGHGAVASSAVEVLSLGRDG